ncbi:PadR family transcriptional regulator [bacterium]|nr:PadR family transcriptional regulator [bacterium]
MARLQLSRFVILGLINAEPMSGYDIKKFIEETIADFWNESYGNIYPTLKKLVEEGLAVKSTEHQQGKPDRMIYQITDAGLDVLKQWLESPFSLPKVRNEFLLKLFFGANVPAETNRKHILIYQSMLEKQLENYKKSTDYYNSMLSESREDQLGLLTLRQGTLVLEARLKWCKEALAILLDY